MPDPGKLRRQLTRLTQVLTRGDKWIFICILASALLMIGYQMLPSPDTQALTVEISGPQIGRLVFSCGKLSGETRRWNIEGPAGGLCLAYVPEKGFHVESSSCPDHICVNTGFIHKAGQTIVCVPNEVSVRLFGAVRAGGDGLDGVLR